MPETCALDVADRGGATLGEVGSVLGVTRERVRQLEERALRRLRHPVRRARLPDYEEWASCGDEAFGTMEPRT